MLDSFDVNNETSCSYSYDAFGNSTSSGTSTQQDSYRDQYYDSETGLYYLDSRYYDSTTGSFTQEDTYWGDTKDPESLNLYGYCEENPVMSSDPTGHRTDAGCGGPGYHETDEEQAASFSQQYHATGNPTYSYSKVLAREKAQKAASEKAYQQQQAEIKAAKAAAAKKAAAAAAAKKKAAAAAAAKRAKIAKDVAMGAGAVVVVAGLAALTIATGGTDLAVAAAVGTATEATGGAGLAMAATLGAFSGMVSGGAISGVTAAIQGKDVGDAVTSGMLFGSVTGAVSGAASEAIGGLAGSAGSEVFDDVGAAGEKVGNATEDAGNTLNELHRPYIRQSVRAEVEANAPKTADGKFIDPNTRLPIEGKYDLGHVPGHEFWREQSIAEEEGLTQPEFNDRMNNPDYYQIEDPASNRSHLYEMP